MATTKKTATKKTAKKAPVKRAPAKSASATKVKRVTATKSQKARASEMESFKAVKNAEPFFQFRVNQQTLYWLVLSGIVLCLGLWVTDISVKVQRIYDQIDANNRAADSVVVPAKQ